MRHLIWFLLLLGTSCGGGYASEPPLPEEELTPKAAVANAGGDVAAEAGFIADGGTITIPSGFTAEQCVFTAALSAVSGQALSTRVSVNKTTGDVTCRSVIQERAEVQPQEKSCTASYSVFCAK